MNILVVFTSSQFLIRLYWSLCNLELKFYEKILILMPINWIEGKMWSSTKEFRAIRLFGEFPFHEMVRRLGRVSRVNSQLARAKDLLAGCFVVVVHVHDELLGFLLKNGKQFSAFLFELIIWTNYFCRIFRRAQEPIENDDCRRKKQRHNAKTIFGTNTKHSDKPTNTAKGLIWGFPRKSKTKSIIEHLFIEFEYLNTFNKLEHLADAPKRRSSGANAIPGSECDRTPRATLANWGRLRSADEALAWVCQRRGRRRCRHEYGFDEWLLVAGYSSPFCDRQRSNIRYYSRSWLIEIFFQKKEKTIKFIKTNRKNDRNSDKFV